MDVYTLLIIGHVFGTILGVGAATFIEIHLNMALADGKMDAVERAIMGKDFLVSRIGLGLCFFTGLGFIWLYYAHHQLGRLADGVFWAKMAIIVALVINAYLLHKHKIGLYWGSALSFVSWWATFLLGMFLTNNLKILPANDLLSFGVIIGTYALVVCAAAWVLHKIREHAKSKNAVVLPPTAPTEPPAAAAQ